jgi:hypothetical protein
VAAVPRTASTGAPTSDGAAVPVYSDAAPIRQAEEKRVIHRFATFGPSGEIVARTDRGVVSAEGVSFTGRTAVERAVVIGNQIAAATGTDAAQAAQLVREYRKRTGSFPDLSQLGNLGTGGAPADEEGMIAPQQASVLGFGIGTWLLLSAIGLVLFLVYGKRGR